MRKYFGFVVALLIISAIPVGSAVEIITKIGVVDYEKVLAFAASDPRRVQKLEEKKKNYQDRLVTLDNEIRKLEARRLAAREEGRASEALDLENEIYKKKDYLRKFYRARQAELKRESKKLRVDSEASAAIASAIEYVAEKGGFILIFKSTDPDILWWSEIVDVTPQILSRLREIHP